MAIRQFEFLHAFFQDHKDYLPQMNPCPFCGNMYLELEGMVEIEVVWLEGMVEIAVVCYHCKAEGPSIKNETPYAAVKEAINAWNLRVPQD